MMNCDEINQYILGFVSKILTERELREFNEHIDSCMTCAIKVISEQELDKLIKEKMTDGIPVAPDLNDKIIKKIEQTPILKITHQDGKEESIVLKEHPITFGRGATNTIEIPSDVKLSREHCRIEYKDGKYEIVDLDSSNGIYVNNQKVKSHCLNAGDKILIGQTNIIFELPVLNKAAINKEVIIEEKISQPKTPQPFKSPQPAPQIITDKKHIPHPRQISPSNSAAPYVAAAAVVLALIGFLVLRSPDDTHYKNIDNPERFDIPSSSTEQSANLQPEINKLNSVVNSLNSTYRYDEALNKCKEFVHRHDIELDENQRNYLEEKMKSLEQGCRKEKDAREALLRLEKEMGTVTDPKSLKFKYDSLYATSSNTSLGPKIKERIAVLEELEKAGPLMTNDISSGNYARAIDRYLALRNRCDDLTIQALITKEIDSINNKSKADFESIIQQGQELLSKKDYEKAKSLYMSNLLRFRGTSYLLQLDAEITSVNKFLVQGYDKKNIAKNVSEKILLDVAELTRNYDYRGAVQKSNEALKIMEGYYPKVSEPLSAKLPDMEKQAALFDKLATRIEGKNISLPRLNLKGTVSNPTGKEFKISGTTVKFSSLTPEEIYTLYKVTWLTTSEPEGITVFCLEHKLVDYAFESLNLLLQKSSKRKPELDSLLARYTGKKVPQDGFIIYKTKWLTPDEKTVMVNIENASNLANKIKTTNKPSELEKICRDFEGLVQATPSQASEFKGIITTILQQRVEEFKVAIQKKLGKTNLAVLSQLKKELNQKRKEALKEIRDGKPEPPKEKPRLSKEMDEKIRLVKTLWEKPAEKAIEIDKSINDIAEMLKTTGNELGKYTVKPKDKNNENEYDESDIAEEPDMIEVLVSSSSMNIRNFPLNKTELRQIEYNQKIMKLNEENRVADTTEKEMVRIINEYRIMMGLQALMINDSLTRASHKHSEHMLSVGQLAHNGIGDGTPSSRAQAEGYSGAVGENCATGQGGPLGYFTAWYWSYGHHLNMIGGWRVIGGGIAGDYATTMFGN
ncbi:MAG: FHA domain-containing protein [Planctomycetota bacterium]